VMTAYLILYWSGLDLRAGKTEGLAELCREAIARCEPLGRITEPTWARCLLGLAALQKGRAEEAQAQWRDIQTSLKATAVPLPARIFRLTQELSLGLGLPV
jgi:hypothetical protein